MRLFKALIHSDNLLKIFEATHYPVVIFYHESVSQLNHDSGGKREFKKIICQQYIVPYFDHCLSIKIPTEKCSKPRDDVHFAHKTLTL